MFNKIIRQEELLLFKHVTVHPRVHQRHPEIEDTDVITAWRNAIALYRRNYDQPEHYVATGADNKSRMLEMVGVETEDGGIYIYHAMKLSQKMKSELGLL